MQIGNITIQNLATANNMCSPKFYSYIIYKITNPSGRVYIGKSKNFKGRMSNYRNISGNVQKQPILYNSLIKYGFHNHNIVVLEEFVSVTFYADERERFYINENQSNFCKYPDGLGMNLTDGGEGAPGFKHKNRISPMKGRKHTDETKAKLSKINKENPPVGMGGKKHTNETKEKMSNKKKGIVSFKKGVPLPEDVKKKLSISMTGRPSLLKGRKVWSDEDKKRIGDSKRGKQYMLGKKLSAEVRHNMSLSKIKFNNKTIEQYSLDGVFIGSFNSVKEAAIAVKVNPKNMSKMVRGIVKKIKGFIFKYKI